MLLLAALYLLAGQAPGKGVGALALAKSRSPTFDDFADLCLANLASREAPLRAAGIRGFKPVKSPSLPLGDPAIDSFSQIRGAAGKIDGRPTTLSTGIASEPYDLKGVRMSFCNLQESSSKYTDALMSLYDSIRVLPVGKVPKRVVFAVSIEDGRFVQVGGSAEEMASRFLSGDGGFLEVAADSIESDSVALTYYWSALPIAEGPSAPPMASTAGASKP